MLLLFNRALSKCGGSIYGRLETIQRNKNVYIINYLHIGIEIISFSGTNNSIQN